MEFMLILLLRDGKPAVIRQASIGKNVNSSVISRILLELGRQDEICKVIPDVVRAVRITGDSAIVDTREKILFLLGFYPDGVNISQDARS